MDQDGSVMPFPTTQFILPIVNATVAMMRLRDLFRKPMPHLRGRKAFILRALMLPNLLLARIEGAEFLEAAGASLPGPCIFAFNHNNVCESLFVPVLVMFLLGGIRVSFVIDWMFGHLPVIGRLMNLIDPVFVYNKPCSLPFLERPGLKNREGVLEQCLHRLDAGISIGIFPEGRRNRDPFALLRAKPGIGHMALMSGAPVIPVGIRFTASARLGRAPLAGRMVVGFGKPMQFGHLGRVYKASIDEGRRCDANRLAEAVAGEVMLSIAGLCGKAYHHHPQCVDEAIATMQTQEAICPA
jgi:1-acyl-sn-glycerol-3-phosphate acyltransferase